MKKYDAVIIGGGAAGFFCAINIALAKPGARLLILEKTQKLLSKVRISGGGRCNITHHCFDNSELIKNYPRGSRELRQVFSRFSVRDAIQWFEDRGLRLKTEEDGRMFPATDTSQSVIDCFIGLAEKYRIGVSTGTEVFAVSPKGSSFVIKTSAGLLEADHVVCCSGGHNKKEAYAFIRNLGHSIVSPVPSLFTFNMPEEPVRKLLQGLSVEYAEVSVPGSRLSYSGPVLITHWGLSGPAVLKLSAFGAHHFFESGYLSTILINWCAPTRQEEALDQLLALQKERARALPFNTPSFGIPRRLWEFLCLQAGIDNSKPWAETAKKELHRLSEKLCRSQLKMQGKTTFKEEFVSCGGVELKEIDFKTMESKIVPGIYFAGEVLNIDGITGGFNFQNAWSTAWICGQSIAAKLKEKEEG